MVVIHVRVKSSKVLHFLILWAIGTIGTLLLDQILPHFVLGTKEIKGSYGALIVGFFVSIFFVLTPFLIKLHGLKLKDPRIVNVIFFLIILVILWIIKKLSFVTGVGIENNIVVIFASACLTFLLIGVDYYIRRDLKLKRFFE